MTILLPSFWAVFGLVALLSPEIFGAKIYLCGDSTMADGNKDVIGRVDSYYKITQVETYDERRMGYFS